jgi:hypothetical protein
MDFARFIWIDLTIGRGDIDAHAQLKHLRNTVDHLEAGNFITPETTFHA